MVGKQDHAIGHGQLQVAFHGNRVGFSRGEL
jgi:hypothetical protein